jgi:hypothetical protein
MTKLLGFRSPQNRDILLSLLVIFASFSPCSAQVAHRRRRSTRSRIIAGVVVGVLAFLALLLLCCTMMRRRRRARNVGVLPTQLVGGSHSHANPYIGGAATHNQPNQAYTGQTAGTGQPIPMSSYDAGHSTPAAAAAAPPPYPGVGDKTQNGEAGNTFAPPPGPPPPAHTAHDNVSA